MAATKTITFENLPISLKQKQEILQTIIILLEQTKKSNAVNDFNSSDSENSSLFDFNYQDSSSQVSPLPHEEGNSQNASNPVESDPQNQDPNYGELVRKKRKVQQNQQQQLNQSEIANLFAFLDLEIGQKFNEFQYFQESFIQCFQNLEVQKLLASFTKEWKFRLENILNMKKIMTKQQKQILKTMRNFTVENCQE